MSTIKDLCLNSRIPKKVTVKIIGLLECYAV